MAETIIKIGKWYLVYELVSTLAIFAIWPIAVQLALL
jgi:hypothetical protein